MRKSPLHRYTPLQSHARLKQKTPLKRTTGLKPQSEKAKAEAWIWAQVKRQRVELLTAKFGFLICEYCKKPIEPGQIADGHHADKNRRHNVLNNARIVHRFPCHSEITDKNLDVSSLL